MNFKITDQLLTKYSISDSGEETGVQ